MEDLAKRRGAGSIILVHGLWMTGWELRYLGWRLGRCGFDVHHFRYRSWRGSLDNAALSLAELVRQAGGGGVHLLGHSLGGVVIARMLALVSPPISGRVALLGSPMRGSALVEKLYRCRCGRFLLGRVIGEGIVEKKPVRPDGRELLVIAGTLPLGFGALLGVSSPHDGTITVAETMVEGARSLQVRSSHMGLVFSPNVAEILCNFFRAAA